MGGSDDVDEQDFASTLGRDRNGALARDGGAIPRAKDDVSHRHPALNDVKPGTSPHRELVDQVLSGVEQG